MRRASLAIALLVFCMLFVGMCIAASDLDNYLGGQLETLFGRVNDEDVRVNAPILGFVGEWIAIFIIYKWIPDWRHNLETYLPRSNMSPLGYLTHAFRGFVYSITYMALLFSAGSLVYEFDNAYDILASTTATVAYFFALLYDIRGLLWHGAAEFHAAGRIDVRKFDWMLPDSIHQEMLNSPALKPRARQGPESESGAAANFLVLFNAGDSSIGIRRSGSDYFCGIYCKSRHYRHEHQSNQIYGRFRNGQT